MKIIKNPNEDDYNEILESVKNNDGYCPCVNSKTLDTKCMCKEFKESQEEGYCHCGLYYKIVDKENT
jgi:hypothetical protein